MKLVGIHRLVLPTNRVPGGYLGPPCEPGPQLLVQHATDCGIKRADTLNLLGRDFESLGRTECGGTRRSGRTEFNAEASGSRPGYGRPNQLRGTAPAADVAARATCPTVQTLVTGAERTAMALNLLVVCIDTLRADLLDRSDVQMPHLRHYVTEGTRFTHAFGEAQPTVQTRRTFFTGRRSFPWRFQVDTKGLGGNGATGWHKIPPEQPTLAERLVDVGYATGLVADTYHIFKPTMNFTRGFLSWEFIRGQESDPYRAGFLPERALADHLPPGQVVDPKRHAVMYQYLLNNRGRRSEEDWTAAQVFRVAERWLADNRDNQPFFLWVDSFDPHEPWDPPPGYADRYFQADGVRDYIFPQSFEGISEAEKARTAALYYGEVTFVDRLLGSLLERLECLGLREDTLVAIVSDHGTELWDDGRFRKSEAHLHPYNTQLNLVVLHPKGMGAGQTVRGFVQGHDLAPTLLDLLGVAHERLDGENFWDLITGSRSVLRDHVVTGWGRRASIRDEWYNVCLTYTAEDERPEVFDLQADPQEKLNLAPTRPEVIAQARSRLEVVLGHPTPCPLTEGPDPTVYSLRRWVAHRFPSLS